jgi:hypothetical protein
MDLCGFTYCVINAESIRKSSCFVCRVIGRVKSGLTNSPSKTLSVGMLTAK